MMKKTCFLFLLLFCGLALMAQDFEIVSVESLPFDMSAREEIYTDHNDRQCALLRIATQNIAPNQRELFNFVPDYGSEVVQRATRDGEIWLWVSPGLKYLRVKHRDWGQYELRLIDHVARVEALHTYKVTIKGTLVMALQEQNNNSPTQQYLVFQLSPTNAMLEVDGQLWEVAPDGTAMKFVNFGTYSYRVQAPNYLPETGTVTVNDPDNTQTVPVSLKPDFVEVTMKVDADAEIWVNNEKKGTRTWTGQLGKGTYKIECKQANHETSTTTKEITAAMEGQTVTLPAPRPIYGALNVESTPNFCKLYIDGMDMGTTPKFIAEILIGQHEIRLTKDGYADYTETITITKGEREQVKASMSNKEVGDLYNGHDYVDLGLPSGTLWATCNVGAITPEDYGDRFAWGETIPKSAYTPFDYKYYSEKSKNNSQVERDRLVKYCDDARYGYNGFTDNKTVLEVVDDAATVNWGSGWYMPTKTHWEELIHNTTCTWITRNDTYGILFIASNGNSLFLPGKYFSERNLLHLNYWSSSLSTSRSFPLEGPDSAYGFEAVVRISDDKIWSGIADYYNRDRGFFVRPVCSPR